MIEEIKILEYWKRWINSGSYRQDIFLKEILKQIEFKMNEIIKEINLKCQK